MEDFGRAISEGARRSHWGKEMLTPMGCQMYLRACGCFAVLNAVSSKLVYQNRRRTPPIFSFPIELSKQEVVDCIPHDKGLSYKKIFGYLCSSGVLKETVYPYEGFFDGDCRCRDYLGSPRVRIDSFKRLSREEAAVVLRKHPITATMSVYQSFVDLGYTMDVYEPLPGEVPISPGRHAVLVIGYGEMDVGGVTKKYCIVQNDWGLDWGVNGFARVVPSMLDGFTMPGFVWDEAVVG